MTTAAPLTAPGLRSAGVAHGFFTRRGGVSKGVYGSLNGGVGSRDAPEAVAENRARIALALGVAPMRLAVPYQVHSPDAVVLAEPWLPGARPRCDGMATATQGLALGVTGADCGMILFADAGAGVIGAAHAGWRGALNGIVEATVGAMETLGGRRRRILRGVGPLHRFRLLRSGARVRRRFRRRRRGHAPVLRPEPKIGPLYVRPPRLYF